jgi:TPR repeat protein
MYGRMLAEGRGVDSDLAAARAWFAKAAAAGFADAQVALGEMMLNGRGGAQSTTRALDFFEQAAAAGHSGAMYALGALHDGVTISLWIAKRPTGGCARLPNEATATAR